MDKCMYEEDITNIKIKQEHYEVAQEKTNESIKFLANAIWGLSTVLLAGVLSIVCILLAVIL